MAALAGGVDELRNYYLDIDLVFDATSASDHLEHASLLLESGVDLINLTLPKLETFMFQGIRDIGSFE